MIYKNIPNTKSSVSVISLGTWSFSNDAFGSVGKDKAVAVLNTALSEGINLVDTAPIYGYGRSEEIIGSALAGVEKKPLIATKCGLKGRGKDIYVDLSPRSIAREAEESLRRLQVECIDIYQCHWPDSNTPIEQTMDQMNLLKKQGKIKYIGVSNFSLKQLKGALKFADIKVAQNHFSFLNKGLEKDFIPFCKKNNIAFFAYGSLGGGILSGKYKKEIEFSASDARTFFYKFYQDKGYAYAERILNKLRLLALEIKKPLNQLVLNWIWQRDAVMIALVGCKTKDQVINNARAAVWELSDEHKRFLRDV